MKGIFDQLSFDDQSPIYLQIVVFVKRSIAAGDLGDGDEIPSRRSLAALLGINPMTVQKAYHTLETEGIIRTQSNARSVVCLSEQRSNAIKAELARQASKKFVQDAKAINLDFKEVVNLISRLWDEE